MSEPAFVDKINSLDEIGHASLESDRSSKTNTLSIQPAAQFPYSDADLEAARDAALSKLREIFGPDAVFEVTMWDDVVEIGV